jgi:hypothetical protein
LGAKLHFTEALEFAHVPRISWISEMKAMASLDCFVYNIESQEPRNHGTLNIIWTYLDCEHMWAPCFPTFS